VLEKVQRQARLQWQATKLCKEGENQGNKEEMMLLRRQLIHINLAQTNSTVQAKQVRIYGVKTLV
jgi:hypothetical protein